MTETMRVDLGDELYYETPVLSTREILEQTWSYLGAPISTVYPAGEVLGHHEYNNHWERGEWYSSRWVANDQSDTACSVGAMLLVKKIKYLFDQPKLIEDVDDLEVVVVRPFTAYVKRDPAFGRALELLADQIRQRHPTWWKACWQAKQQEQYDKLVEMITAWNDDGNRTWAEVDQVFEAAIKEAVKEEEKGEVPG